MNCNYPKILQFKDEIVQPGIVMTYMQRFKTLPKISSFIYFISDGEYVKIGSAYMPEKRMKDLQVGNARELKLLFTIPVYRMDKRGKNPSNLTSFSTNMIDFSIDIEKFLHQGFGANHIRGEWFDILNRIIVTDWRAMYGCETKRDIFI